MSLIFVKNHHPFTRIPSPFMNTDMKRLIAGLICIGVFAIAITAMKFGLEYIHINGVADGVMNVFRFQIRWFITIILKISFTAGIVWVVIQLTPLVIKKLKGTP